MNPIDKSLMAEKLAPVLRRIAWAYFFLYFNITIGPIDILPSWAGYLMIFSAIPVLALYEESAGLLRNVAAILAAWSVLDWVLTILEANTYGSGLQDSCENTRTAISQFLLGAQIDYYVSMNMDAIGILNDAVGGVTVEVTDDFSQVDPTIGMGTVKLNGQQALNFVRTRKDVGDQLNLTRMERQKAYIQGFSQALRAKIDSDATFVISTYEELEPYIVTDCSAKLMTSLLEQYSSYSIGKMLSPAGENVMGEKYFEFYVDEEDLKDLVLQLFYAPK